MKIGIIGAFDEEIEQLIELFSLTKLEEKEIYGGKVEEKELIVARSGIGKVNAAAMTQYVIDHYHPDLILNSGCAGSLKKEIKIMDVILSSYVTYHDFEPERIMQFSVPENGKVMADHKLIALAEQVLQANNQTNYWIAPICSGDCFVTDGEMRDRIYAKTGAYAVDMESGSIGHICKLHHVPFLSIRTISDFSDGQEDFEVKAAHQSSSIVQKLIKAI